jgi:DNA-binding IclR family transcriptional regulator
MSIDQDRPAPASRQAARALAPSKAPAIARAAAVLRLLGRSDRSLGVQEIARELGQVPSTCLHVLRALVAEEFVAFDSDTKRYALEAGVLTLARHWLQRNQFTDVAQPFLDRISRTFGVTMIGVHIVGIDHIIVVGISQAGQSLQLSTQIGSRFPALISATGRCIAAFGNHADAKLEAKFKTLRWDKPPSFAEWQRQVSRTRELGFAIDEGNYISGVTVLAAPVWRARGKLSHALVALGIGSAVKRAGAALPDALCAAARTLSHQLSGELPARS